jgi:hypothetical protein
MCGEKKINKYSILFYSILIFVPFRYMDRVGTRHSLLLHRVEPADFANYTCAASNKIGTAVAALRLSGAPQAPRLAEHVDYLGRGSYRLSWSTESCAAITNYTLLYRKLPVSDRTVP